MTICLIQEGRFIQSNSILCALSDVINDLLYITFRKPNCTFWTDWKKLEFASTCFIKLVNLLSTLVKRVFIHFFETSQEKVDQCIPSFSPCTDLQHVNIPSETHTVNKGCDGDSVLAKLPHFDINPLNRCAVNMTPSLCCLTTSHPFKTSWRFSGALVCKRSSRPHLWRGQLSRQPGQKTETMSPFSSSDRQPSTQTAAAFVSQSAEVSPLRQIRGRVWVFFGAL